MRSRIFTSQCPTLHECSSDPRHHSPALADHSFHPTHTQAKKFFKSIGSDIPETEQLSASSDQIEGVPAIKAKLPAMKEEAIGMAYLMAGSVVKDVPFAELEFGVEDWGSFEMAVDAYEADRKFPVARLGFNSVVLGAVETLFPEWFRDGFFRTTSRCRHPPSGLIFDP